MAVGIEGPVDRRHVVLLAWARREKSVGDAPG
jgi:hypothetical protein